jgi:hypothetical protein
VLIGCVVDHEIDHHSQAALMAGMRKLGEVAERAVAGVDVVVVRDVVAGIKAGRRLERHQPDSGNAEALQIIKAADKALEVADAVAVCVHERADREAIDDCILVPEVV